MPAPRNSPTVWLRSLAEIATKHNQPGFSVALDLTRNEKDLVCRNIICERLTQPCVCRLSRAIERIPDSLHYLCLRNNDLDSLPDSLFRLRNLRCLDLSSNNLRWEEFFDPTFPDHFRLGSLQNLRRLKVAGNPMLNRSMADLQRWEFAFQRMPNLHQVWATEASQGRGVVLQRTTPRQKSNG